MRYKNKAKKLKITVQNLQLTYLLPQKVVTGLVGGCCSFCTVMGPYYTLELLSYCGVICSEEECEVLLVWHVLV